MEGCTRPLAAGAALVTAALLRGGVRSHGGRVRR